MTATKTDVEEKLDQLENIRKIQGITKNELAGELDVSRTAIYRWKQGSRTPSKENLEKIKNYISNAKIEQFIENVGENTKANLVLAVELDIAVWAEAQKRSKDELSKIVAEALEEKLIDD